MRENHDDDDDVNDNVNNEDDDDDDDDDVKAYFYNETAQHFILWEQCKRPSKLD